MDGCSPPARNIGLSLAIACSRDWRAAEVLQHKLVFSTVYGTVQYSIDIFSTKLKWSTVENSGDHWISVDFLGVQLISVEYTCVSTFLRKGK